MDSASSYQQVDSTDATRLIALISSNIQKTHRNVSQMQRNVQLLGTDQDSERVREEITQMGHDSNSLMRNTNEMLKKLVIQQSNTASGNTDPKQLRVQTDRLRNDLIVVMNNLQSVQRAAAAKEKESIVRARQQPQQPAQQQQNPFDDDGDHDHATFDPIPHSQRDQIAQKVDVAQIREREQAIQQLESDIVDLNHIFKDLAVMVHEQGDMVDSIADNVERASVHVEAGGTQIAQALNYQRAARKKKVCMVLFLITVAIIVVIVIWATWPSSK